MTVILIMLIIAGEFAVLWGCVEVLARVNFPECFIDERESDDENENL